MRVVYYAFGGGHGHALRGLAILRRVSELAPAASVSLLAPGRFRKWARWARVPLRSPPAERPDAGQLDRWLEHVLGESVPDLMFVDVFPRGVLGELSGQQLDDRTSAWLVSRSVDPDFYLQPDVRAFIESTYRGLIWGEAPSPALEALALPQRRVAPLLLRRADDCLDREAAREQLPVDHTRVAMAILAGDRIRQEELRRLLRRASRRARGENEDLLVYVVSDLLEPESGVGWRVGPLYPAMHYMRAADLVIAAGGYHSFHETQSLGVRAAYMPQTRRYDDQYRRVAGHTVLTRPEELESALIAIREPRAPIGGRPAGRSTADGVDQLIQYVFGRGEA